MASRADIQLAIETARPLVQHFEGLRLRPYLCSAGVPTIGYGATFYEDGRHVTLKDEPITRAEAEHLLGFHLKKFVEATADLIDTSNEKRLAALADFAFNLGINALRHSTLRRKANEGNWEAAAAQLLRWNKAGGRVIPGLTTRRMAEAKLLLAPTNEREEAA